MSLHWMAHGLTFDMLGEMYNVGVSIAHAVVHLCMLVMKDNLVKSCVKFPSAHELNVVMARFEAVAGLPICVGAMDDTFVHMLTPALWGDTYW